MSFHNTAPCSLLFRSDQSLFPFEIQNFCFKYYFIHNIVDCKHVPLLKQLYHIDHD